MTRKKNDTLVGHLSRVPLEVHLPGYKFCGVATKLEERIKRGDKGINSLDEACKQHDIAYMKNMDKKKADLVLIATAKKLSLESPNVAERFAALLVSKLMGMKGKPQDKPHDKPHEKPHDKRMIQDVTYIINRKASHEDMLRLDKQYERNKPISGVHLSKGGLLFLKVLHARKINREMTAIDENDILIQVRDMSSDELR